MIDSSVTFAMLVVMLMFSRAQITLVPGQSHLELMGWTVCQSLLLLMMAWHVVEEFKRLPQEVYDGPDTGAAA